MAPHADLRQVRYSWRHDSASNTIRLIRLHAHNQTFEEPNLSYDQFEFTNFWNEMGGDRDSWGNPFQIVQLDMPNDEFTHNVHAYSFGEDGISKTNGNDPDDINSWNYCRTRYYGQRIQSYFRKRDLLRTLWLTPIVFCTILLANRLLISMIARYLRTKHDKHPKLARLFWSLSGFWQNRDRWRKRDDLGVGTIIGG